MWRGLESVSIAFSIVSLQNQPLKLRDNKRALRKQGMLFTEEDMFGNEHISCCLYLPVVVPTSWLCWWFLRRGGGPMSPAFLDGFLEWAKQGLLSSHFLWCNASCLEQSSAPGTSPLFIFRILAGVCHQKQPKTSQMQEDQFWHAQQANACEELLRGLVSEAGARRELRSGLRMPRVHPSHHSVTQVLVLVSICQGSILGTPCCHVPMYLGEFSRPHTTSPQMVVYVGNSPNHLIQVGENLQSAQMCPPNFHGAYDVPVQPGKKAKATQKRMSLLSLQLQGISAGVLLAS